MKKWTDEDLARIAGMKRAGMSSKAIAERMGTTVSAINKLRAKTGAYARLDHSRARPTHQGPHKVGVKP